MAVVLSDRVNVAGSPFLEDVGVVLVPLPEEVDAAESGPFQAVDVRLPEG